MTSTLAELLAHVPQVGRVSWIGLRPEREAPIEVRAEALLLADRGIEGDRTGRQAGGSRQVTLVQWEHLDVLARLLGREQVDPALLRRNVAVAGINLRALMKRRFRVGEALLEGTGGCHPCRKMEAALGDGGYAAMRGHGGITARILEGGRIAVGDPVRAA
ncbi:MAG: MOSC domain-containing protein [Sandaracinaceae bacterium]